MSTQKSQAPTNGFVSLVWKFRVFVWIYLDKIGEYVVVGWLRLDRHFLFEFPKFESSKLTANRPSQQLASGYAPLRKIMFSFVSV